VTIPPGRQTSFAFLKLHPLDLVRLHQLAASAEALALIIPALFSRRTPPDRERREESSQMTVNITYLVLPTK
jgi:hypothetical protein